ncbi:MAG: hypothetical protein IH807_04410, partial [Proteobacteria bacterium]|nr:hypothetical protein [Pseudomonadota bacterium]
MPIQILMPALSPTMSEGNLTKWLKREGDEVRAGEVIAEIETDKATMELEAADDGKLGRILVADGTEGVKVNRVIALLLEDGETESDLAEAVKGIEAPEAKASEAEAPAAAADEQAAEVAEPEVVASVAVEPPPDYQADEALISEPGDFEDFVANAEAHAAQGLQEQAIASYTQALRIEP